MSNGRKLIRIAMVYVTVALLAAIVWWPETVNGADFAGYAIVWAAAWFTDRELQR